MFPIPEKLFNYNIVNGAITITEYISKDENRILLIPAQIRTIPVKTIASHAFFGMAGVKKVIVEKGITTISSFAFADSLIEYAIIPATVTSVGSGAFENCKNLKEVYFHGDLPKIHDLAFNNCSADVFRDKNAKDWEFLNLGRPIHQF